MKYLSVQDYAAKYNLSYAQAYRIAQNGKVENKLIKGSRLLADMTPPETSSTMDKLKEQKAAYEILRLKQMQENERQVIKDEAIKEYRAELSSEIIVLLRELKRDWDKCLVEDPKSQAVLTTVMDNWLQKLASL